MATASAEAPTRTAYRIQAHEMEMCNCEYNCNCQFGGFPNHGCCEFLMGLDITDGYFGDVSLTGVRVAVAAKYPGAIHEGNGHVVVFIDENASPEQVNALVTIFTGQAGGMPWEALAGTVTRLEGPIQKPIEMEFNGRQSRMRVPDILDVQMEPIKNPVTGETQDVHITYPSGGFLWNDGQIATTGTMRIEYGDMSFEYPNHFAATAEINWTNEPAVPSGVR